jgi:glutaredoxin|tara:strand:+ start:40748 stop:41491 length:744 start_codon:yes stop_codon:yes gene_type:complete
MSAKTAELFRMETPDHICPYGLKALDLLRRKGFEVEDHTFESHDEVDAFKAKHEVETTPQAFINGKRIGGYDALREHFGMDDADDEDSETTYRPVIALFGLAAVMAVAFSWAQAIPLLSLGTLKLFVGVSMCLLALQKLQDLDAFSLQLLPYDLLSQRWVRYSYVYPFVEAFVGVGMLANLPAWLIAGPAILIGAEGAVSVFKAVYIDKRELKCACVGGDSSVPLGFVSLTENLMMVVMPLLMLLAM